MDFKRVLVVVLIIISFTTVVFASNTTTKIEVVLNQINIAINGKKVQSDNILYKGTTYVPLRVVGGMMGKVVVWDEKTNTAGINDKPSETDAGKTSAQVSEKDSYTYVGSTTSNKFHTLNCSYGKKIGEVNKCYFKTRTEAIKAGYEACKECNP